MQRSSFVILAVSLLILATASFIEAQTSKSLSDKLEERKRELEKIRLQISTHREKTKELSKKERSLLKKISALEKEGMLLKKLLANAQDQEKLLEDKIDSLSVRISIEGEKLIYQRERLKVRLRQLYMREPNANWAMLLGSGSFQEVYRRHKFLRLIAERDAKLLEEVKKHKLLLEIEQAELTEALADVAEVRRMREEESKKLAAGKKKRLAMLRRIKNEKSRHEQAINDLKKAQDKLKDLIGSLEKKRLAEEERLGIRGVTDFAKLKGHLMKPVKGRIVKRFGKSKHPKFGTVTFNTGVDFKANPGSPIRAVAKGTIEFVDWITGYGRCIIVNHGGGYYTLYAHVSDVFVETGQGVSKGEVIAEVGDTGSIEGYVCHFEIRKSKKALDPLKWFAR